MRKKMHFIKMIIKFCAQWSTVDDVMNSNAGGFKLGKPGPEVIKPFSCSTQLSMNFFLLNMMKRENASSDT